MFTRLSHIYTTLLKGVFCVWTLPIASRVTQQALTILFVILSVSYSSAQQFQKGARISAGGDEDAIQYDRTQAIISKKVYQTSFRIYNKRGQQLYTVKVVHDRNKSFVTTTVREANRNPLQFNITYKPNEIALIFSDKTQMDTSFSMDRKYDVLVSFADSLHEFVSLHKITLTDGSALEIDPLTIHRVRKHNQMVLQMIKGNAMLMKRFIAAQPSAPDDDGTIAKLIFANRDTMLAWQQTLLNTVAEIRNSLLSDSAKNYKQCKTLANGGLYKGDKKKGLPEGEGLLINGGSIYKGIFHQGVLTAGVMLLRTSDYEYCGEYDRTNFNGNGYLKFKNGTYYLGNFSGGKLMEGILMWSDVATESYYGTIKNFNRTGYGELRSKNGDRYCGDFLNGRLVRGYISEAVRSYYSSSRFENGKKTPISFKSCEEIFSLIQH